MASGGDNLSSSSSSTSLNNDENATNANAATTATTTTTAVTTAATAMTTTTPELKVENNPDGGIWITSQGVFYFKLNTLHIHLQYFYSVLKVKQ